MNQQEREPISSEIKREVRQRCGFGCVICGNPIYEYDHIEEWSVVKEHKAENLTLLCPQHHSEKTKKLLPKSTVIKFDKNPYCKINKKTNVLHLFYDGYENIFDIGSNVFTFTNDSSLYKNIPLIVFGKEIMSFRLEDEHLLLNMDLFDQFNNKILEIQDNELTYSTEFWDIRLVGNKLTINQEFRNVFFEIEFVTPNKLKISKADIFYNSQLIKVKPTAIVLPGNITISGSTFIDNKYGIVIG
ncbi:HNH endonuclease [Oceanobacillus longus]|uniref:HNH endonuclease n=1 Tax=Oceanobacillus longus TaxID=930120 RepID=A0ABV8H030_9BACI